jgi:hypothetical protein
MDQVMFSLFDQRTGRFLSPLRPFNDGPRHCGQFSAAELPLIAQIRATIRTTRFVIDSLTLPRFVAIELPAEAGNHHTLPSSFFLLPSSFFLLPSYFHLTLP